MSFFLVGGGVDDGLGEVYDEFIAEARTHTGHQGGGNAAEGRIAVVVAGPSELSGEHASALSQIVTSRWPQAEVTPIHLTGAGTSPDVNAASPDDPEPTWEEDPDFALPEGLDTFDGIIVGGGRVASYIAGLGPAADLLSRLVRGGAPWLGFSAGAMVTAVAAVQGGWRLNGRQVAPQAAAEGVEELTIAEGLGLVSVTSYAHNDVLTADGLLISAVEGGLLHSAVAIDEGTCLKVQQGSGRAMVMGEGLVRWFTKDPVGVVVRSERGAHRPIAPAPTPPKFAGLAQVAAATRAAHKKQTEQAGQKAEKPGKAGEPAAEPSDNHAQEAPAGAQETPSQQAEAPQAAPATTAQPDAKADDTAGGADETASGDGTAEEKTEQKKPARKAAPRKRSTATKTTAKTATKTATKATTRRRSTAKSSEKTSAKTASKTSGTASAKEPAKRTRKTQKKTSTAADTADQAGSEPVDPAQAES